MKCYDCPRQCGADRDGGKIGICGGGKNARIAKIIDGFAFEEPCLGRSLTAVFFGGCALKCSYCQNYKISRGAVGREYTDAELAEVFGSAAEPLDLVTPSHYLGAIERALEKCGDRKRIIYNTSGYETPTAVERASAFTDVFLTDFKYAAKGVADRYSKAPDYAAVALAALEKMRGIADEWAEEDGRRVLKRGLVVRHLVLPGHVESSLAVLDEIARNLGTDTVVSIMSQYTPNGIGEPDRKLKKLEYKLVVRHAQELGFRNGYIQEFSSADAKYTPKF